MHATTKNYVKVNDLTGIELVYACCLAKKLDVRLVPYTDTFGIYPDNQDTLKFKSLNNCKHFRLSEVLPYIKSLNQINISLHSGWQAIINENVMYTAPTFYEVIAKVFVYSKLSTSVHIPKQVSSSTEIVDNYFLCSEEEL